MADMNNTAKKSSNKLIIAIVAVIAIALIAAYATGILGGKKSSDEPAFAALSEFFNDKSHPLDSEFGLTDLSEKLMKKSHIQAKVSVDDFSSVPFLSMFNGVYINLDASNEGMNSLLEYGLGIGSNELVNFIAQINEQRMKLAVPKLLDKVLLMDLSGDLKSKVKASPIYDSIKQEINEADLDRMIEYIQNSTSTEYFNKVMNMSDYINNHKGLNDAWTTLKSKAEIVKAEATEKLMYDGSEVDAVVYEIKFQKEDVVAFFETVRDIVFKEDEFKSNVTDVLLGGFAFNTKMEERELNVYEEIEQKVNEAIEEYKNDEVPVPEFKVSTTPKGKLAKLAINQVNDGKPVVIEMFVRGGNTATENMELVVDYDDFKFNLSKTGEWKESIYESFINIDSKKVGEGALLVKLNSNFNKDTKASNFAITVSEPDSGEELFAISATGKYDEIVKGSKFNYVFDNTQVSVQGMPVAVISGNLMLSAEDVKLEHADLENKEELDFFTMTESDFEKLGEEIQKNIEALQSSLFGGF